MSNIDLVAYVMRYFFQSGPIARDILDRALDLGWAEVVRDVLLCREATVVANGEVH